VVSGPGVKENCETTLPPESIFATEIVDGDAPVWLAPPETTKLPPCPSVTTQHGVNAMSDSVV
jgi:hypothetical protein